MRTPARRRRNSAALAIAFFALAAWSAGWSVHAVHALRASLWPNLVEICGAADPQGGQPGHGSQCPVCSQFLAATAPQQPLAAPAGLLGIAEHEAVVARTDAALSASPLVSRVARAPPAAA
ncbi:MAG TPA: hypothetical protein VEH51_10960 [Burkholderiales bacterium]|nr:hypothetical protein [Burkholderiales bacterium]